MNLYLAHLKGDNVIDIFLIDKKETSLGKSTECDIVINANFVSSRHAKIIMTQEGLVLRASKSGAHIIHNGKVVDSVKVFENEEVGIGLAKLLFIKADNPESAKQKAQDSLVKKETIEFVSGVPIKNKMVIGRSAGCDIRLNYSFISRNHALIEKHGSTIYLSDMGSQNGTFVNSKQIFSKTEISETDKIQVGNIELEIINGTVYILNKSQSADISCENLTFAKNGKVIIKNVSFSVSSGELVAVIGGSGEGKSTLLKLLSGFAKPLSGEVLINGIDATEHASKIKNEIGYVAQNNVIANRLSIEKNIYYYAKLRLPQSYTSEQIASIVSNVIKIVDLGEHRAYTFEQLSEGQKKRAVIAIEILANPNILFLDEPTSGLDEHFKLSLIQLFKSIASRNKIVFVATSDIKNLCIYDKVMLINNGELLFYGTPEQLKSMYQLSSFEEIYQKIRTLGITVSDNTIAKPKKMKIPDSIKKTLFFNKKNSLFFQFFWLTMRYCEIIVRNPSTLFIWIVQAPIIALLIALVFYNTTDNFMLSFVISISTMWYSANNSVHELVKMDRFYKREKHSGLNTLPFLLSVFFVLSVITVVETLLFICVLSFFINIKIPISHLMLYSSMTAIIGTALGLLVSSLSNSTHKSLVILSLGLIIQLLFSGILVDFNTMTALAREISRFMPLRWSFDYTRQLMMGIEHSVMQYVIKFFIFAIVFFIFTCVFQRRKNKWVI